MSSANDWSDIATAPRDGRQVVTRNSWGRVSRAHFDAARDRWIVEMPEGVGHFIAPPGFLLHWMPL